MKSEKLIEVPAYLETKLSNLIDRLAASEKRSKRNAHIFWISGIAASVAILFLIGFFYSHKNAPDTLITSNHIIIDDPEIGSIEAQKALLLIAVNFNKGVEQLNLLSDNLQKTNDILNKTLKP